jgi:hypothetical protein
MPTVNAAATLAILPGAQEDRRVRVELLSGEGGGLRLTQETFSEGVGWFAQGCLDLAPSQVAALREFLGAAPASRPQRPAPNGFLSVVRAG